MINQKWSIDPTHSELQFKVKHLMISNVTGGFQKFEGHLVANENLSNADVHLTVDINSISTGDENRDGHLKGADFFGTDENPTMEFTAKGIDINSTKVDGNLQIKGVTKPVTLDLDFGGIGKDPWGNEKMGVSISTKINRSDFGLIWNAALETGGVLVSDEVKINGEVQFVKVAE